MLRLNAPARALCLPGLAAILCPCIVACGDDGSLPDVEPLPDAPQILPDPDSQDGTVLFPIQQAGDDAVSSLLLLNGGRDDLVIQSVDVGGEGAAQFAIVEPTPEALDGLSVASREALLIRLRFAPSERGYHVAQLTVRSNAANLPELVLDLIGPATAAPTPAGPDIVLLGESERQFPLAGGQDVVRFVNLGGQSLLVQAYALVDTGDVAAPTPEPTPTDEPTPTVAATPSPTEIPSSQHFSLAAGTANPGARCSMLDACNGGLECTPEMRCAALAVPPGLPVGLQVIFTPGGAQSYEAQLSILSDDPDTPSLDVALQTP